MINIKTVMAMVIVVKMVGLKAMVPPMSPSNAPRRINETRREPLKSRYGVVADLFFQVCETESSSPPVSAAQVEKPATTPKTRKFRIGEVGVMLVVLAKGRWGMMKKPAAKAAIARSNGNKTLVGVGDLEKIYPVSLKSLLSCCRFSSEGDS